MLRSRRTRFSRATPFEGHRVSQAALAAASLCFGLAGTALAQEGASVLPSVTVTGEHAKDMPSERSNSYTVRGTTVGSKLPATLKETPHSVSVITHQRIEDQNLTTLDEAMAQTNGVTVDLSGTAVVPSFYSRGYPVEYFQYDSVPIQTGGASWAQPDLLMFDHVEMLRGAAGLFNGAGQPGGVINLVRKRPLATRQFSGSLGIGSWNARRAEVDYSTPLNSANTVRARFAAAYDKRDSHVDVAHSRKDGFYGIVEADLTPRTLLSFGIGYQKRDWLPAMMGLPRYKDGGDLRLPRSTFLGTRWTHWDFETTQVFADLTHAFNDDWQLKLSAVSDKETSDLKYSYVTGPVDRRTLAGPTLAGGANAYENRQLALDATLTGAFRAFGRRHELVVGANWYDRKADSRGGRLSNFGGKPVNVFSFNPDSIPDPGEPVWTSDSRTDTRQHGLYGVTRLKLADPLTLILGGRVSWWETESRNQLTHRVTSTYRQNGRFTPYAGLVYDIDPTWSLYASYADIFRVQSNYKDRNGDGLPPVTGANYEAGIKGAFYDGKLNTAFAVFRIDESNRAVQTSPTIVDSCCYTTNGRVQSQGFEAEVSGQAAPGWQVAAGYTFNTSKYKEDGTLQGQSFRTFSPKHLLRVWTTYQLPGDWNAWSIGGGVNLQSRTYNEGGTPKARVAQGGYAVASLRVGYRINEQWSAALNINNLFDRTYYTRLGSGGFGPANFGNVYGEPRSAMLTVRAKF